MSGPAECPMKRQTEATSGCPVQRRPAPVDRSGLRATHSSDDLDPLNQVPQDAPRSLFDRFHGWCTNADALSAAARYASRAICAPPCRTGNAASVTANRRPTLNPSSMVGAIRHTQKWLGVNLAVPLAAGEQEKASRSALRLSRSGLVRATDVLQRAEAQGEGRRCGRCDIRIAVRT